MGLEILDTTLETLPRFGICGYSKAKTDEISLKSRWMQEQIPLGLRLKTLYSPESGTQGLIEYIPGKYCWRPADAGGYLFIHCLFVGFRKEFKNKGWGSRLLEVCMNDARSGGYAGVAAVTRKGSFMAKKDLFIKHGFTVTGTCAPDFELLAYKFDESAPDPAFKESAGRVPEKYGKGLFILRAGQCPYTLKNVREMTESAESQYRITPEIVELKTYEDAQNCPSPFGTFCIIHDGEIVTHHPISRGRFENIMAGRQKK